MGAGKGRVHFFPDFGSGAGGQKFQLLVRKGHRVTVELSRQTRQYAGLAYGPLGGGRVSLAEAHRVVKFIACGRGERSRSNVTFWSGGVLARSPQCVPLRIFVDGATAARHRAIHLGVRRCRKAPVAMRDEEGGQPGWNQATVARALSGGPGSGLAG
jgi:hypothetical protein